MNVGADKPAIVLSMGDSGSPFFCKDGSVFVIRGVFSEIDHFGNRARHFSTKVTNYLNWISETMNDIAPAAVKEPAVTDAWNFFSKFWTHNSITAIIYDY
uniref:Peptidase S1 domain-containing protein n=1 Tax=Romanomermis culicivorax TaxID=13658 RepID=A0A915I912_ROMCU